MVLDLRRPNCFDLASLRQIEVTRATRYEASEPERIGKVSLLSDGLRLRFSMRPKAARSTVRRGAPFCESKWDSRGRSQSNFVNSREYRRRRGINGDGGQRSLLHGMLESVMEGAFW